MRTDAKSRIATSLTYVERVNLAIDHIRSRLDQPLQLKGVARAAMLSPFHFHRVFHAVVGETVAEFVKRLRLEQALAMMAHAPRTPLTTVALSCGFSSPSDFSRCFKHRYGASPSAFNINAWRAAHGDDLQAVVPASADRLRLTRLPVGHNPDGFRVRIRDLPARTVAYVRVHNPYRAGNVARAAHRLVAWAERHALADGQWLGYQWDNPEITSIEDCQYHIAVEAERFLPKGEVGRFRFPPMVVAEIELRGEIDLELRALQWLYGTWLPRSGYVPDNHPCFEAFIGRPFAHGAGYFELHAQLPIKRASSTIRTRSSNQGDRI